MSSCPAIERLIATRDGASSRDYFAALGALGGDEAEAILVGFATTDPLLSVRLQAVAALEHAGNARALSALEGLLADAGRVFRPRRLRETAEREIRWTLGVIRRRVASSAGEEAARAQGSQGSGKMSGLGWNR